MHVKMRHALADTVIHRHEGPVRFQGRFNRARQKLGILKKRADQIGRKIAQGLMMSSGNQQAMSGENRTVVEESKRDFVCKDQSRACLSSYDLAKQARYIG